MAEKIYKSRIFNSEWKVDDKDKTIKYSSDGKELSLVAHDHVQVVSRISGELEEELYKVNGKNIPFCPRGYVVSGIWCPTIETAAALSAYDGGATISIYDEVV